MSESSKVAQLVQHVSGLLLLLLLPGHVTADGGLMTATLQHSNHFYTLVASAKHPCLRLTFAGWLCAPSLSNPSGKTFWTLELRAGRW
jgi:hypothetical protein